MSLVNKSDIVVIGAVGAAALLLYMNKDAVARFIGGSATTTQRTEDSPYTGPAPTSNLAWSIAQPVLVDRRNNTIIQGPQPGESLPMVWNDFTTTPDIIQRILGQDESGTVSVGVVPGGSIVMPNGTTYTWGRAGLSNLPASPETLPGMAGPIATSRYSSPFTQLLGAAAWIYNPLGAAIGTIGGWFK